MVPMLWLSVLLQVKDRNKWRDALENGSYDSQTDDPAFVRENPIVDKKRFVTVQQCNRIRH